MPSTWDMAREWLTLTAVAASAFFAGLIWWLARKRLTTRFAAQVSRSSAGRPDHLYLEVTVLNRGDRDLAIEAISVTPPWFIPVGKGGGHFGKFNKRALMDAPRKQIVPYTCVVTPDDKLSFTIALGREGGLSSCKRVSIRLHILKSFPVIRHKKKVLTAILPANIRNSQA